MTSYHIGMTVRFREALKRLEPAARGEVVDAALRVQDGHAAVHVHKLESSDFVAFTVNRNALRVIALREGNTLVLLHVDAHDAAYDWAARHRTVRVGEVIRLVTVATEEEGQSPPEPQKGPLADIRDRIFGKFGVGPHAAAALRRVATEDEVVELAEMMRPALASALIGLATDPDDLVALVRNFEQARQGTPPAMVPLAEAAGSTANAATLWLAPSAQALQAAMEGSLRDWQVFLHPSQLALVRKRFSGAAKVTGGPGTGKTVVAVHRARFLAETVFADDPRPVLLTTFSRTLAEQLEDMATQVCADAPELRARIEVLTLVGLSQRLLRSADRPAVFLAEVDAAWAQAMEREALGLPTGFYKGERAHVLARSDAWSEAQYLVVPRPGRPERLDRAKKRAVWRVLEAFDAALAAGGGGDDLALARDAASVIQASAASPWSAVVCDEVQDATASALRLLAALTRDASTGNTRPDALFLCGDGYQRLYQAPMSLVACGIEVRGRSRQLRLNYRTTEGIRRAAVDVISGLPIDALDQAVDDEAQALDGYRSLRGGPPPAVRDFDNEEAEATWIALLAASEALLVLARTTAYRDRVAERLRTAGVAVLVLEGRGEPAPEGVTVCTLHRSKGLEAARVVIAGAQLLPLRFPGDGVSDRAAWERQEKCLLYVGMTRARDWCGVSRVTRRDSG